jgi:hypothetical protein
MTISKTGNVGIGTTSPTSRLSIVAATAIEDESILRLSGGSTGFSSSNDLNQEHSIVADLVAYSVASGSVQRDAGMIGFKKEGTWNEADNGGTGIKSAITFKTQNGSISSSSLNERMRITSSGNVGIGTTTPTTALTIRKVIDSAAYGSGTQMIDFKSYFPGYDTETVKASIYAGVSDKGQLNTTAGYLAFMTSDGGTLGERMRIERSGSVLVGTTSTAGSMGNAGGITTGGIKTYGSSAALAASTPTTIATISQAGLYIVHAYIPYYNAGTSDWSNFAIISCTAPSPTGIQVSVLMQASGSAPITFSTSGANIRATVGSALTLYWDILKLA